MKLVYIYEQVYKGVMQEWRSEAGVGSLPQFSRNFETGIIINQGLKYSDRLLVP